jgi:hypothetical protein
VAVDFIEVVAIKQADCHSSRKGITDTDGMDNIGRDAGMVRIPVRAE